MVGISIAAALLLSGCSSSNGNVGTAGASATQNDPTIKLVKTHSFITDYPDTTLETIINKFISSPEWSISSSDNADTVTVKGKAKNLDKDFTLAITVQDDPEDPDMCSIEVVQFSLGNFCIYSDSAWTNMEQLYTAYANGDSDLTELDRYYMLSFSDELISGFEWADIPAVYNMNNGGQSLVGTIKNASYGDTYARVVFNVYDNSGNEYTTSAETSSIKTGDTWTFAAPLPISYDQVSKWSFGKLSTSVYDESDFEEVTVQSLFDALHANAMRAETYYQDRLVKLSGYISTIDSDGKYFSLTGTDSAWELNSVLCTFTDDSQRQSFMSKNKGDYITVWAKITSIGEIVGYYADVIAID